MLLSSKKSPEKGSETFIFRRRCKNSSRNLIRNVNGVCIKFIEYFKDKYRNFWFHYLITNWEKMVSSRWTFQKKTQQYFDWNSLRELILPPTSPKITFPGRKRRKNWWHKTLRHFGTNNRHLYFMTFFSS